MQKTLLVLLSCFSSSSWPTHSGDTLSSEPKSRISAHLNQACTYKIHSTFVFMVNSSPTLNSFKNSLKWIIFCLFDELFIFLIMCLFSFLTYRCIYLFLKFSLLSYSKYIFKVSSYFCKFGGPLEKQLQLKGFPP